MKIYVVVEKSYLLTMLQHDVITCMVTIRLPLILRDFYLVHCLRLVIYLMTV